MAISPVPNSSTRLPVNEAALDFVSDELSLVLLMGLWVYNSWFTYTDLMNA